jgi:hypothetical protein
MKTLNRDTLIDWIYKKLGQGAVKPPITKAQLDDCLDDSIDYYTFHAGGTGHEEQYAVIDVQMSESRMYSRVDENGVEHKDIMVEEFQDVCYAPDVTAAPIMVYKSEYQLPRNVLSIGKLIPKVCESSYSNEPILERGFALTSQGILSSGIGGIQGAGFGSAGTALWTSNMGTAFNSWGGRGGAGTRGAGGGADLVGYELGLEYLEMLKQRYTLKMDAQFLEESKKVRFSPAPKGSGIIILPVWCRVEDSALYDNIWVRNYAFALAQIQIGYNTKKYTGASFPGGANIDGDFYLNEGKEMKQKLEEDIDNNKYNYPVNPFWLA